MLKKSLLLAAAAMALITPAKADDAGCASNLHGIYFGAGGAYGAFTPELKWTDAAAVEHKEFASADYEIAGRIFAGYRHMVDAFGFGVEVGGSWSKAEMKADKVNALADAQIDKLEKTWGFSGAVHIGGAVSNSAFVGIEGGVNYQNLKLTDDKGAEDKAQLVPFASVFSDVAFNSNFLVRVKGTVGFADQFDLSSDKKKFTVDYTDANNVAKAQDVTISAHDVAVSLSALFRLA